MFISLEGPDGAGKTTQIKMLIPWLESIAVKSITTREPGGTEIGNQIRDVLMNMKNKSMNPRTEILLFCSARAQLVEQIIKPALASGITVISDRYADSTMAYQGYGHRMDLDTLRHLLNFATGGCKPDLTLLLDIPSETGLKRRLTNHEEWNRMDDYTLAFHMRVREGYLTMAAEEPDRWAIVDAAREPEKIQQDIRKVIQNRLNQK